MWATGFNHQHQRGGKKIDQEKMSEVIDCKLCWSNHYTLYTYIEMSCCTTKVCKITVHKLRIYF
jgi:hypothetical protein